MIKHSNSYNLLERASAIFLALTLVWLTVSTPFIIGSQQTSGDDTSISWSDEDGNEDGSDSSSGGNNVEEKAPPGSNLSEEFLHEWNSASSVYIIISRTHKLYNAEEYVAFHGELHAPPPNAA